MTREVWFELVDGNGRNMTALYFVRLAYDAVVAHVWEAVTRVYENNCLRGQAPSNLLVFATRAAFAQTQIMNAHDSIAGVGQSPGDPIVVQVPLPLSLTPPGDARPPTELTPTEASKPQLRWKPAPDLLSSLQGGRLHFVNRDDAVKRLCKVHESWFTGATKGVRGGLWSIPLIDNELGLGKTAFGYHYVQRCKEEWPAECQEPGFQESLRACRTLRVLLRPEACFEAKRLASEKRTVARRLTETLDAALAKAVEEELAEGTPVPDYIKSPQTTARTSFVEAVVRDLGPVFIVLDEVGEGFASSDNASEEESRDLFLLFCRFVLSPWMRTRGVYFVLVGYAPFLRNVGERKDFRQHPSSPFEIVRLSLQLIRPTKIKEILVHTKVSSSNTQTLAQRWELTSESQIQEAADTMYFKTCGHPRRMVRLFQACESFEAFQMSSDTAEEGAFRSIQRQLRKWQPVLEDWLPCILDNTPIDLSGDWPVPGESDDSTKPPSTVSFAPIMYDCELGWEGTVDHATVYALPRILTALIGNILPLRSYIATVRANPDRMSLDRIDVFQLLCLKRFQELFAEPGSPHTVLPTFFGADTVVGKLRSVVLPRRVIDLPAITTDTSEFDCASLDSATAHPNCWSALMREIDAELELSPTNSVCLKPLPQSWSPDVILMRRVKSAINASGKRPHNGISTCTVTIGVAVKHDSQAGFEPVDLSKECDKFTPMFTGLDCGTKASFGEMKKVLIVCATRYSRTFNDVLRGKAYSKQPGHASIDEVLLLDLMNPEKRAEFFGCMHNSDLRDALNDLVDMTEPI